MAFDESVQNLAWVRPARSIAVLEEELAAYLGVRHVIATASGTAALVLAFLALELGPDQEVLVPANTFVATAAVPRLLGSRVRLVDVNPTTYLISPAEVAQASGRVTDVVVPVHLYGRPCDVGDLRHTVPAAIVLEEACQALGARGPDGMAGSTGSASVFSFGREKAIASIGEGGAVATDSDLLADKMRRYCNQGAESGDYISFGLNLRMDPIQAAIIRSEVGEADAILARRRQIAQEYTECLSPLGIVSNPAVDPGSEHGCYLYVVEVDDRPAFMSALAGFGVELKVHYKRPVHFWSAHRDLGGPGAFPVAERLAERVVSLPLHERLRDEQVRHVIDSVRRSLRC
ncbi:DegT/DnrJ/EryC1/StrS family aminotransferase [Nonomuraea sp. NPDC048901]|uniref:DegT/DnrJ/EryC1/StrS family aminotransferase n=1 Tax=Nonomuraea sp. NPDC048901 TaxID=3155627 RepID=UPI00340E1AEA